MIIMRLKAKIITQTIDTKQLSMMLASIQCFHNMSKIYHFLISSNLNKYRPHILQAQMAINYAIRRLFKLNMLLNNNFLFAIQLFLQNVILLLPHFFYS